MKKIICGCLITVVCVAMVLMSENVQAQNQRIGTSAASELLIPVGGRDLALGGSSISTTEGVEAIYWNPAGLGRLGPAAEGIFSYMSYIADIGVSYGAVAGHFGSFGVVGLSVKALSIGDIPLTTSDDPEGESGRFFSPTYFTFGLSFGRQLTDNISAGISTKVVSETIDQVSATGLAFDIGIQYNNIASISGLGLGVTVKNIGPEMKFDGPGLLRNAVTTDGSRPSQPYSSVAANFELPSLVEIGMSYTRKVEESFQWSVSSTFTNNNLYLDQFGTGGELGYLTEKAKLFGRLGYRWALDPNSSFFASKAEDDIYGVTAGAGVSYASTDLDITFDYAFREAKFFSGNHVISVKLGF